MLPKPLQMGKAATGGYNTAPLKRYTPSFCRGIASILQHAASVIPFTPCSDDSMCSVFASLKDAYLKSSDDDVDGADYAPNRKQTNLVQDPPKAVF